MSLRHWLVLAILLPLQVFAQSPGKITFVEGKLRVIRNASIVQGVQGLSVEAADILETSKPGFALVEFPDGTVFALGDSTRVLVARVPQMGKAGSEMLLLEGWLKGQSGLDDNAPSHTATSATQSANWRASSLIMHGTASAGEVFVESGSASLGVVDKRGKASNMAAAKAGQFITRAAEKPPVSQPRPTDAFLSGMPGAFKDALPSRLDRFKDRTVEARPSADVAYADVGDWLAAPQGWRSGFLKRFEPRLIDPAFRQQLDARLKNHPEWGKVLRPPRPN